MSTFAGDEDLHGSSTIRDLVSEIAGPVLQPGDEGYESECAGYNLSVPLRPAVVVGATTERDVQAAVRFAARKSMPVAVLGSGHGSMVPAEGALLINTRRMDSVTVDAWAGSARVGAGVRMHRLVEETAPFLLAPLTGSAGGVTVAGYTLGGGLGPLSRAYGFASDRVLTFDLVTADGVLRHVTPDTEPELFWAVRGGKGNFGVVTAIEVGLVPVVRLYGGVLVFPGDCIAEVVGTWSRWTTDQPDAMTSSVGLLRVPPFPPFPELLRGKLIAQVRVAYLGGTREGERLIEPLRAIGPRLLDTVAEMPFAEIYSIYNEPVDPLPFHDRSLLLRDLPAGAVEALVQLAGPAADSPVVLTELLHLGGALTLPAFHPSAVGARDAGFALHTLGLASPDEMAALNLHLDELIQRLAPWSTGRQNVNYLSAADANAEGVRRAYESDTWDRLVAVKRTYDPDNIFRVNFNINPA
ncbi:FAD-binding oxidoreductase [Actinoplanes sp. TBRC 11911]|uniref:FAD-binding oxidoreductase n=1 Tax=Actinoplanes sp. TBRC 11911 TaxID=2729386 RepID=UPI00145C6FA0|nr:FAD-binding oxidoreductase [Actinoplanes sp. TBRC 11911]NMO55413.1 FAD-binding oxidoreductase [Actinoplanes sp. TBRC 11911]